MELQKRRLHNKIVKYYPETGLLRRDLYGKHIEFFGAGGAHQERLMIAANRVGKTEGAGGYESVLHLTGRYPDWWQGHRFDHGIICWACGQSSKTVRDILQLKLLGKKGEYGTGLLPGDAIFGTPTSKPGVPDAVETVQIRHKSGRNSLLIFKSYDQGLEAFQGSEVDLVWFDEEPPLSLYTEGLMRTMPAGSFAGGRVMITFTPLLGWSEVVEEFLNPEKQKKANRFVVNLTWDDVPHLGEEEKKAYLAKVPLYQRDARSKGVPQLGSGAIYPVSEDSIKEADIEIPKHWPRVWGLDHGWDNFACLWGALDRDSQTLHIYAGVKIGSAEPAVHVQAIKARGDWIPGVGDAAALNVTDGTRIIDSYRNMGLDITLPDKSVEAGIWDVWELLSAGRLRVFQSVAGFFEEFRIYRRDEKGRVVKEHDHYMDCVRYIVRSGLARAICKAAPAEPESQDEGQEVAEYGWMQ